MLARRIERLANEGWLRWVVLLGVVALAMVGAHICRVDQEVSLQGGTGVLPPTDLRVAMVTHGGIGDPFWDEVAAGAFAAQREFGIELFYDGDGNVNEQVRLVDNAVALGYDVLIVSLADPDALEQSIRSAVAAGLLVKSINSGEERGREFGAVTHFGQPDGEAGLGAGERLVSAGVRNLLCLIHEAGNVGLEARCANAGVALELAGGSMRRLFVVGTADRVSTTGEIAAQLQADPSIDGILALNSGIAELAMAAIDSAGSDAKLATFDTSLGTRYTSIPHGSAPESQLTQLEWFSIPWSASDPPAIRPFGIPIGSDPATGVCPYTYRRGSLCSTIQFAKNSLIRGLLSARNTEPFPFLQPEGSLWGT